jgi:hypothetical protein
MSAGLLHWALAPWRNDRATYLILEECKDKTIAAVANFLQ